MSWIDTYKKRLTTPEEALNLLNSGNRVWIHPGCAAPLVLIEALTKRAQELEEVEIIHILTVGGADYTRPEMESHVRHNALFVGDNVREAVNSGRADYTPIFLGEIWKLVETLGIDVAMIQLSKPDEHGFCSYGVGVDMTMNAAKHSKVVIAEINTQMPRTLGDCFVHVSKLDAIVESNRPLSEKQFGQVSETAMSIGKHVADLIEDGSTLQMGIGQIPDAVLTYLGDRQDLGVHTEMFSDGVVDLIEEGVINNERKTLHPGKVISGFMIGTKRLFEYVDDNPIIEMHPTRYTNDPFIIAQNDNMIAINSAIAVDLTGQVSADSIGTKIYSGFGGQTDFIRGAARSKGGKPIIALPSTARKGTVSRIVPSLAVGAGVVTTRADVHWVVTEFGAVNLFGKTVRKRTEDLISISHPGFQEDLTRQARELHYLE